MFFLTLALSLVAGCLIGWFAPLSFLGVATLVSFLALAWARLQNDGSGNESGYISAGFMIFILLLDVLMWSSHGVHWLVNHLSIAVH